jgi:hypothetical protein
MQSVRSRVFCPGCIWGRVGVEVFVDDSVEVRGSDGGSQGGADLTFLSSSILWSVLQLV